MSEFTVFDGVFRPSWRSQTKNQNSGTTKSTGHGFEGFVEIYVKSVGQIWRIFAEKG